MQSEATDATKVDQGVAMDGSDTAAMAEVARVTASGLRAPASEGLDRRRIEEQLAQLELKKRELSRALVLADHPHLQEPLRILEGRVHQVRRIEAQRQAGPAKADLKRAEGLRKKREGLVTRVDELRAKLTEAESQLGSLDQELRALGEEREASLRVEAERALAELVDALHQNAPSFADARVDPSDFVDGLAALLSEPRDVG